MRAEKTSGTPGDVSASEVESANGSPVATAASAEASEALVIDHSGDFSNRETHALKRTREQHEAAVAALAAAGVANDPVIGALNRHLNMLTQQLGTAHRLVGRIAAERDALRQQLADMQGVPVDQIVVTSTGASTEEPAHRSSTERHAHESSTERHAHGSSAERHAHHQAKTAELDEPEPKTVMARLNYFSAEDVAVARKRRQMFALALVAVVVVLWLLGRMGFFQVPANLSKDSLAQLPFVGELMSYFLAGWVLYRMVRIGGKGVKWVFPSEPKRKRR